MSESGIFVEPSPQAKKPLFNFDLQRLNQRQKVTVVVCLLVMFFSSLLVILNYDTWITRTENITYGDGCTEHYVNGKLNSSICEYGRSIGRPEAPPGYGINFTASG